MEPRDDPYELLGVPPTATPEEIRAAYHELVARYHPDQHQFAAAHTLSEGCILAEVKKSGHAVYLEMKAGCTMTALGTDIRYRVEAADVPVVAAREDTSISDMIYQHQIGRLQQQLIAAMLRDMGLGDKR